LDGIVGIVDVTSSLVLPCKRRWHAVCAHPVSGTRSPFGR